MNKIGDMAVPEDFSYERVLRRGRPKHERFDAFWIKHPNMDIGHRAKIFSPYDALKGFSEIVATKEVLYVDRVELGIEDQLELDRRLHVLQELTVNSRTARKNRVEVTAVYYEVCSDRNNFAYGKQGQYVSYTGVVKKVDALEKHVIVFEEKVLCIEDVILITGEVFGDVTEED